MSKKPSRYLWKKFVDCFDQGCQFWTSEDGCPMDWVIMRCDDWRKWFDEWALDQRGIDVAATLATKREAWVFQEWSGTGENDGYFDGGGRPGKVWRISKSETPFPVFTFDPKYLPRGSEGNR